MATVLAHEWVPDHPVDTLRLHPRNPRRGDVDLIAESISVNGFYGAVIVQRSTGFVLAGNHRLLAAQRLGLTSVPAVVVDVDDEQAVRILLADNGTSDAAIYDETDLAAVLASLADSDLGLAGSGWHDDEMADLLARLEADVEGAGELLDLQSVTIADPDHDAPGGSTWRLGPVVHDLASTPGATAGPHHLAVCSVSSEWERFVPLLTDGAVLLPYPGPYLAVTELGLTRRCVFVQPDPWVAGHLLDKWSAVFGARTVARLT